jgi:hypothetical protein
MSSYFSNLGKPILSLCLSVLLCQTLDARADETAVFDSLSLKPLSRISVGGWYAYRDAGPESVLVETRNRDVYLLALSGSLVPSEWRAISIRTWGPGLLKTLRPNQTQVCASDSVGEICRTVRAIYPVNGPEQEQQIIDVLEQSQSTEPM